MKKEIIEKYIQFAIDNWLDLHKWISEREDYKQWTKDFYFLINSKTISIISNIDNTYLYWINLINLITSKSFIEAIANIEWINFKLKSSKDLYWWSTIEKITFLQADAIRDWKLEEFILSIIK